MRIFILYIFPVLKRFLIFLPLFCKRVLHTARLTVVTRTAVSVSASMN